MKSDRTQLMFPGGREGQLLAKAGFGIQIGSHRESCKLAGRLAEAEADAGLRGLDAEACGTKGEEIALADPGASSGSNGPLRSGSTEQSMRRACGSAR
jgi:hypothetical protein